MSNIKISELPVGIDIASNNLLAVVQAGETRKVTISSLQAYLFGAASVLGDVDGNLTATQVVALRGQPISNVAPVAGQALVWNGSLWSPSDLSSQTVSGDIDGTVGNATVFRLRGRSIAATAPTPGQVLGWNGTDWTPVNVTVDNNLSGDVTGTTAASVVARIQGRSVVSTAPTNGQVLSWNGTAWAPATITINNSIAGDVTGTLAASVVTKIQGRDVSNTAPTTAGQYYAWSGSQWIVSNDNDVKLGGNTLGSTVSLGTNDNFAVVILAGAENTATFSTSNGKPLIIGQALTATNNAEVTRLFIQGDATGSTQNGYGSNIHFNLRSSTTSSQNAAQFAVRWLNSSHAARTSNIVLRGVNNAGALSDWLTIGPTAAAGTVGIRIAGGTTEYRNTGILPGNAFVIGGNSQQVLLGQSTGLVSMLSGASGAAVTIMTTQTDGFVQMGGGNFNPTTGTRVGFQFLEGFNPTSGGAEFHVMRYTGTINQQGSANGATSFLCIEPTITAAPDWRAIRIMTNTGRGISQEGPNARNYFAGRVAIGTQSAIDPFTLLQVTGVGGVLLPSVDLAQRATITSFAEGLLLYNSEVSRFEFIDAASNWSGLAIYESHIKGQEALVTTSVYVATSTQTFVRFDANANPIAVELGANLIEGVIYTYRCTRNTANTVTFNAAAGFLLALDGDSALTPTQLITGASGTGIRAPHKIYTVRRIGGNVYIS